MSNSETVASIRQRAREAADATLSLHWEDEAIPVDPVVIARELGISVFESELGEDTWGMLVADENGTDIYLDQDQPPTRMRFSCAHELGHYVERSADLTDRCLSFVDKRSAEGHGDPHEIFANEFAGSLLMPPKAVAEFRNAGLTPMEMAAKFHVSLQAMRLRLSHLYAVK